MFWKVSFSFLFYMKKEKEIGNVDFKTRFLKIRGFANTPFANEKILISPKNLRNFSDPSSAVRISFTEFH